MDVQRSHLIKDSVLILLGISFAVFLHSREILPTFVDRFQSLEWVLIFFAGFLFTSVFTTATAIVFIFHFAHETPLLLLAVLGGLGALTSDYLFFRFMKDSVMSDIRYLISLTPDRFHIRFPHIFRTRLSRYLLPLIGAIIIASPIPDEIGVSLLSLSHMNRKLFVAVSFVLHSVSIFVIAFLSIRGA